MEDAHIASPALVQLDSTPISLFGVFDGHGGKFLSLLSVMLIGL